MNLAPIVLRAASAAAETFSGVRMVGIKKSQRIPKTPINIPKKNPKKIPKNPNEMLPKSPKYSEKLKHYQKIQEFPKKLPKSSQDFENIQFLISHLEAENPFGLVCFNFGR